MNTKDELSRNMGALEGSERAGAIKQWPEATAPANTFAGAAQSGAAAFSTFPVVELDDRSVNGDNTDGHSPSSLPYGGETEYVAPPSNLPMTVSAEQSRQHNCEWQAQTPWNAETPAEETMLAGTIPATRATAPASPRVVPQRQRDGGSDNAINPGDPEDPDSISGQMNARVDAEERRHPVLMALKTEDRGIEDSFAALRRRGGGY